MADEDTIPNEHIPKKYNYTTKTGRPQTWTPDNIAKLQAYIDNCPHIVPSVAGFCLINKISRSTIDNWFYQQDLDLDRYEGMREFRSMLGTLNFLQEQQMLEKGASREIDSGIAKLVLSKHGYRQGHDVTSDGESIKPSISIG